MSQCLRFLLNWAMPLTLSKLDFGDVVAVLIVVIGLASFVTAGLWSSP
jgi:hypothetical protein